MRVQRIGTELTVPLRQEKEVAMPPSYVKTLRDELYYEYAKLMSRSAFNKLNYGFIGSCVKGLRSGNIKISESMREWKKEQELAKQCVFCGALQNLEMDHLIPRSRKGADISDNMVWSCKTCNTSRGNRRVYEWLGLKKKDYLHRLVAGKYLKELKTLHENAGTIDIHQNEIEQLCSRCNLGKVCEEWKTAGELSCFCLESIIE